MTRTNKHHRHDSLPASVAEVTLPMLVARELNDFTFFTPNGPDYVGAHRDSGHLTPDPMAWVDTDGSLMRSGYGDRTCLERSEYPLPATLVKAGETWSRNDMGLYLPA